MQKERKYRTAASVEAAIILSVALFLLFFSIELLTGYCSSHAFRESLRQSNFAANMEQEMLKKQKALFASYGLPESLTEEIWKESDAYLAFYQYMDSDDGQIKKEDFKQKEVLEAYLQGQNTEDTEDIQEALDTLISESKTICRRYMYPSFVVGYQQLLQVRKPLLIGLAVVSAAVSAGCAALIFYWYRSKRHALRYVTGGCVTAMIWNLAGTAAFRTIGWFSISGVESDYYLEFLEMFRTRGMYPWYFISIAAVCLAVVLWGAGIYIRSRR